MPSVSVIVPCRNEVGNIEPLVGRLPELGSHTELIFVDGDSSDGTVDRIHQMIAANPERDIRVLAQGANTGKAGAVFQGFDEATGDILIILDADMTVAPEDLPVFVRALSTGEGGFANGTRFLFAMEAGAMPPLNNLGNRAFSRMFSAVLRTRVTDTLCGTKALRRDDWPRIKEAMSRFGGHDPWGDFDLLLGAAWCGLRIVEVPVRYHARVSGESKMHALRHGTALARTLATGARTFRFRRH